MSKDSMTVIELSKETGIPVRTIYQAITDGFVLTDEHGKVKRMHPRTIRWINWRRAGLEFKK